MQQTLFNLGGATDPPPPKTHDAKNLCLACGKLICRCAMEPRTGAKELRRNTDPPTSRAAARQITVEVNFIQWLVFTGIGKLIKPEPGQFEHVHDSGLKRVIIDLGDSSYTANEIAAFCSDEYRDDAPHTTETYRKRCGELLAMGAIETTVSQLCRVTGRMARGFKLASGTEVKTKFKDQGNG